MIHALLVLGAAILWGTTGTAAALGPDGIDPLLVGAGRVVLGGAMLTALGAATHAWRGRVRYVAWRDLFVAASAVAAYQLCFFAGVARAGVAVGTLIAIGSAPIFTGLIAWPSGQGRPSRAWAVTTALAIAGCVALARCGDGQANPGTRGGVDVLGIALALGAGLCYAGYTIGSKRLTSTMGPTGAMAAVFGSAAVLMLPVLLARIAAGGNADRSGTVAVVLYLAVVPTAIAYLLFGRGLAGLQPPVVATLSLAEPLIASTLGVVVLGEAVTPMRALGATLIFAGLAGSMVTAQPRR